jgi:putative membrane protein
MTFLRVPVLHGVDGFPTGWLHSNWVPDPSVVFVAFVLAAGYVLLTGSYAQSSESADREVSRSKQIAFLAGTLAFLIALGPPLDDWSDSFLLSAHMAQHMILLFVVAPLWLYGTPAWMLEPLARNRITNRIGYLITRPVAAFFVGNAALIFWHFPGAYDLALRSEPVHLAQHLSFLLGALIAWWPVLSPIPAWPRLSEPLQCLYLFLFGLPGGVVGAFITFATPPLYHFYETSPRIFGIALDVDQQLAGLMMWVGGSAIYFLWITRIFLRWGAREDQMEYASAHPSPAVGESRVHP